MSIIIIIIIKQRGGGGGGAPLVTINVNTVHTLLTGHGTHTQYILFILTEMDISHTTSH